jgi:hypothetical protein
MDDLAAAPYLLDQLDPDSVAVAVLRTAFGRSDLPAPIGASLSARHLFNRLDPEDRLMTRWIAVACGSWARASDSHAWARIGEREPPHVSMFGHQGAARTIAAWRQPGGGTLLVTSGNDGVVRVWDPMTGRPASAPSRRMTARSNCWNSTLTAALIQLTSCGFQVARRF